MSPMGLILTMRLGQRVPEHNKFQSIQGLKVLGGLLQHPWGVWYL